MTDQRLPLERMIAGWMADEAVDVPVRALDDVLAETRRITPQPRWWALLRERPLRAADRRVAVGIPHRKAREVQAREQLAEVRLVVKAGGTQNGQAAGTCTGIETRHDGAGVNICVSGPLAGPFAGIA